MIIWGGDDINDWGTGGPVYANGAAYTPSTNTWRMLPDAPIEPRTDATLIWTGRQVIAFGGRGSDGNAIPDGAEYDPASDSWNLLPPLPNPGSTPVGATAVWTGNELLSWVTYEVNLGSGGLNSLTQAAALRAGSTTWDTLPKSSTAISTYEATMVWTGSEVLAFGGSDCLPGESCPAFLPSAGTVYAFQPVSNRWTEMTVGINPVGPAISTGNAVVVDSSGQIVHRAPARVISPSFGMVFDIANRKWLRLPPRSPSGFGDEVWTGSQFLIWWSGNGNNTGIELVPATESAATNSVQGFNVESATFVSAQTGWVIGTVTCASLSSCELLQREPVLLRTNDSGRTWTRDPLPSDDNIDGVRFADPDDGWVYAVDGGETGTGRDDIWETHDGRRHWEHPRLPGAPEDGSISDVEVAAGTVFASFNGFPPVIESSPANEDNWRLAATLPEGAGGAPYEQIVLQGKTGWAIDFNQAVLGGSHLVSGAWSPWTPPCRSGPSLLAASDALHLVEVCDAVAMTGADHLHLYLSSDGGSTFQPAAKPPPVFPPDATGIASPAPGVVIMGGAGGDLIATFDYGTNWDVVAHEAGAIWLQVGFVNPERGFAINENGPSTLLMTSDGGHAWVPAQFPPLRP